MAPKKSKKRISDVEFTSFIADGTEVSGAYGGKTHLLIEGVLHGDVDIDGTVMVAPPATVTGDVTGVNVIVAGRVSGGVRARKIAEVRRQAIIKGDVVAREIYIAVGAKVGGEIIAHGKKGPTSFRERRRTFEREKAPAGRAAGVKR